MNDARTIIVTIQNEAGVGLPASVHFHNENHIADTVCNENGTGWFLDVPWTVHYANLDILCSGYDDLHVRIDIPDGEYYVPPIQLHSSQIILPPIINRGNFFGCGDQYWTAIEGSDFNLLGRYLNNEDITPILEQRRDVGFNLLRVWTRYAITNIGICTLAEHPDLYDRIPAFLDLCANYGLYVEFTAYTGREDFDPNHWGWLGKACSSLITNVILELINEADQSLNKIDLTPYNPIPGILCSHGSNGSEQQPVTPYWDYPTFHTNSAFEWQRKCHNGMEYGYSLVNEQTRFTDNDASTDHSYDSAATGALLTRGSCYHSVRGKTSELWDGLELECAYAHCEGARSVPLKYQDGEYVPAETLVYLQRPNDIRVYRRKLSNTDYFDVHVRK